MVRGAARRAARWSGLVAAVGAAVALGQAAPEPPAERPPWQSGPRRIALGHALTLELPGGYAFLPREPAIREMERMGNLHNQDLLGLVAQEDADWLVTVSYQDDGHVKDEDAAKLDPDAILADIRAGTEAANAERAGKGFKAIHVVGWSERPRYDPALHQLSWGVEASSEDTGRIVNFRTRILGRTGYAALNLIDAADQVAADQPAAGVLLAATRFDPGARYEDFDAAKDQVAEYGLAALVAGGAGAAAVKAGLGAKLLGLLLAAKKLVVLGVVGLLALLRRLFVGRGGDAEAPAPPADRRGPGA